MYDFPIMFSSAQESHDHALQTLNQLYEYDDFMMSVDSVVDVGCGAAGLDLEWWATRTTRDDNPTPLNIDCVGMDIMPELTIAKQYQNITYRRWDFEENYHDEKRFDIVWCHNSFQYALNPLKALANFHKMLTPGGMLALMVPQTTNIVYNKQEFEQHNGIYYHYSLVNIIHMLAVSGFDCKSGFFMKNPEDPWINAVVYKSEHQPMDPRATSYYDLIDLELLPATAERSVNLTGHIRQKDLILPWLNKAFIDYGKQ